MTEHVTALEDRVVAVVAAGPERGSRFVDVWLALDERPTSVHYPLRRSA